MKLMNIPMAFKELGARQVYLNLLYRLKVGSGYYWLATPSRPYEYWKKILPPKSPSTEFIPALLAAGQPEEPECQSIIAAADEIMQGTIHLYGAIPTRMKFDIRYRMHWTKYESNKLEIGVADIKDLWEPARFSWAIILAQAYSINHDEKYPGLFWEQLGVFLDNNPPNIGPQWMSGQEVALRLIALVFAWQAFKNSLTSTPERIDHLRTALVAHAKRIATTLVYARSQRNNHLLSEAAGLYTVSLLEPNLPDAVNWKKTGWNLLLEAWRDQISPDGSYIQQSVSYHRLLLQLCIWVKALSRIEGANDLPEDINKEIILAIDWLDGLIMSTDGHVPNMGSNDGANILPLGAGDISDYRPVIKLARHFFLSEDKSADVTPQQVIVLREGKQKACMRVAHYHGRPSHADQLHLDLWWNNLNIALDAGTFRYNLAPPWNNSLASTAVHNTISIDGTDQMVRAGRFLWLRHANIHNLNIHKNAAGQIESVSAEQDGYGPLGATHWRCLTSKPDGKSGWLIQDDILPIDGIPTSRVYAIRLSWLVPDWDWEADQYSFRLVSPAGIINLGFTAMDVDERRIGLDVYRAGEALTATRITNPTWGWHSPTYGIKEPALAIHFHVDAPLPIKLSTHWCLPD